MKFEIKLHFHYLKNLIEKEKKEAIIENIEEREESKRLSIET